MKNKDSLKISKKSAMSGLWISALGIFGRFSALIVGPVIIGAVLGAWLDKKFHTEPWIFFISIVISFIVSMIAVARQALEEYQKQEERSEKLKGKK